MPQTEAAVLDLLDAASSLERKLDRALSGTRGISFREYRLLKTLATRDAAGYPRIELAHAVGLTPSAVTRALRPLEKLGYVTTRRNGRDARQSLASITPGGRSLLDDVQGTVQDLLRSLPLSSLGPRKLSEFRGRLHDLRS